jgi:hypothetical protein
MWKLIKTIVGTAFKTVHVIYRVIMFAIVAALIGGAAYVGQPLYRAQLPTVPTTVTAADFVRWRYLSADSRDVYQQVTVHADGRAEVMWTRKMGDFDIPEHLPDWQLRKNHESGLIEFTRPASLSPERATALFNGALHAGVLDVLPEHAAVGERLEVSFQIGARSGTVIGAARPTVAPHWQPDIWYSRKRWQTLAELVNDEPALRAVLAKTTYTKPNVGAAAEPAGSPDLWTDEPTTAGDAPPAAAPPEAGILPTAAPPLPPAPPAPLPEEDIMQGEPVH